MKHKSRIQTIPIEIERISLMNLVQVVYMSYNLYESMIKIKTITKLISNLESRKREGLTYVEEMPCIPPFRLQKAIKKALSLLVN